MWHLEKPSKRFLDDYAASLLPSLVKRVNNNLTDAVKDVLLPPKPDGSRDNGKLHDLLTFEPVKLFDLSESMMKSIIHGYDINELKDFSVADKVKNPTPDQINLINKYKVLNDLKRVFNYDGAIGGSKPRSYKLTAMANHNTCIYCNRQYTFTVERNGGKKDNDRIARPALDHWFPQSLFPLMSLSFYNLIPCCTVCNSSAKLDDIWMLSSHIHPYLTNLDVPKFKFRYKAGLNASWTIGFKDLTEIEENTIKSLCLQDVYQMHSDLEVADLIELATKNNGSYLKQLYGIVLGLYADGGDKIKAYRLLLGTEIMREDYKNRPLSKLKRDIIAQIEEAQGIKFFE